LKINDRLEFSQTSSNGTEAHGFQKEKNRKGRLGEDD